MKTLSILLIVMWNSLLHVIGRSVGMFIGGLFHGFKRGMSDIEDGAKYLKYRAAMAQKELDNDDESD